MLSSLLNGLRITTEANIKIIDFLDVTFNLKTEEFYPYVKPGNIPLYVHAKSNHPPSVIKNIPLGVNARLSSISSNEKLFLKQNKFMKKLCRIVDPDFKYEPQTSHNNIKANRKQKIIYLNPPISKSVSTNVGARFLRIIDKCFPKGDPLNKILNKDTLKFTVNYFWS